MNRLENGSTIGGYRSACIVGENTETDFSALLRAVWSNVVFTIVVLVVVVVIVVVVVPAVIVVVVQLTRKLALVVIHFHFSALHVVFEVLVGVILKTATIVIVVLIAIVVLVIHLVHVCFDVSFHVNEVVSVVRVATLGGSRRATVGGAHAKSNKALGQDLDVVFAVSFVIPLLDVVASLELDTVTSDVTAIDIVPVHIAVVTTVLGTVGVAVVLAVTILNTTSILNQLSSSMAVQRDVSVGLVDDTGLGHDTS